MAADDDETVWMPTARNPRDNVLQGARGSVAAAPERPRNKRDLKPRNREVTVFNPIARGTDSRRRAAIVRTGIARPKRNESLDVCGDAISINLIEHADDVRVEKRLRGNGCCQK